MKVDIRWKKERKKDRKKERKNKTESWIGTSSNFANMYLINPGKKILILGRKH